MRKAVLVIAILVCVCNHTFGECPTEKSISEKMDACMEKLLPGSSHDKVLAGQIKDTIEILHNGERKELQKIDPGKTNATMKQLTIRVCLCFADELLKGSPEITTAAFDCAVYAKNENSGKCEDNHEIQECVRSKLAQICPMKIGKSKRSLVALLFN